MSRLKRSEGIALTWTVLVLLVMVGFVGLAIDMGFLAWCALQLQSGSDASSLAGAQWVRADIAQARNAAVNVAGANTAAADPIQLDANFGNAAGGDVVIGFYHIGDETFTVTEDSPNAVKTVARRTDGSLGGRVQLFFGHIFNVADAQVARDSTAMLQGGIGAGVIALDPTQGCSFDVRGTAGTLVVNDGAIYVNSDNPEAACHAGQPTVDADEIYVSGGTDNNFEEQVNFEGNLFPDSDPIPDPLADLPEPTYDPADDLGGISVEGGANIVASPGYYSSGISVQNGTLTLEPGVYILGGPGLSITGGNFIAEGVHIFVESGPIDIRGNGIITITPPDTAAYAYPPSPDPLPYEIAQVPLFQGRDNTSSSRILGTANLTIEGTIYGPAGHLEIGGDSENFGNGLIWNTIEAHGNGTLVIDYEGQFGELPRHVWLVE